MGYQALLFCPDEKIARVVTHVLSDLEFSIETATEPFAAVKKLMAQHFDAIVVDCENEQNATLVFKSARNSSSNQASLAVAVVEGQAGVAKAFRIGANLVLTKPINVEQAKGTLRVARGLLRKGSESAKSSPAATAGPPVQSAQTQAAQTQAARADSLRTSPQDSMLPKQNFRFQKPRRRKLIPRVLLQAASNWGRIQVPRRLQAKLPCLTRIRVRDLPPRINHLTRSATPPRTSRGNGRPKTALRR